MKVIEGGFGKASAEGCASELFTILAAGCKASEDEGVPVQGVGLIAVKGDIFEVGSNADTLEETQVILAVGATMMLDIITGQYRGEVE